MKIVSDQSSLPHSKYSIATIGYFDGIHLGHKKILSELISQAKQNNGQSILITFWPHPRNVLNKNTHVELLLSNEEKIKSLESLGVDILYIIEFTLQFSKIDAHSFIETYLVDKLNIDKLILGYNHCFGHKRQGNFLFLKKNKKKYSFDIQEIQKKEISSDLSISSSAIRENIRSGNLLDANKMLGYRYFFKGKVIKGDGIGKKLGYPTANIEPLDTSILIPKNGVYVGEVVINNKLYGCMINIGTRPTVNGKERRIELHIFHFKSMIYDKIIIIKFIKKMRDERKFINTEELKNQLKKDELESLKLLKNEKIRN